MPDGRYLSGSGLPMPLNGSRRTAWTRSSALRDTLRLVDTQYRRSSMNSGWKTGTNPCDELSLGLLRFLAKTQLPTQFVHGGRWQSLGLGALKCSQQALRVLGRPEQMGRLDEAFEFIS